MDHKGTEMLVLDRSPVPVDSSFPWTPIRWTSADLGMVVRGATEAWRKKYNGLTNAARNLQFVTCPVYFWKLIFLFAARLAI